MRSQVGLVTSSVVFRLSTACVLALGVSACSSDTMRFSDAPFTSPFKSAQAPTGGRDPATTGSVGRAASAPVSTYSAPAPAVASVRSQPLPPPQSASAMRAPIPAPISAPAPVATGGASSGWSAQGGTPIVVAQGETVDVISSRYGVPRAALMSANGLSGPALAPGSQIVIPVYNANAKAAPAAAAPAPRQTLRSAPVQSEARPVLARPAVTRAAPAPTANSAARIAAPPAIDPRVAAAADAKVAADAQAMRDSRAKFAAEAKAKAEARKTAAAAPVAKPVVAEAKKPAPAAPPEKTKPVVVANAPAETRASAVPKSEPAEEPRTTASIPKPEEAASDKADFRWPARGRVIAGFSGKGGNEGINIAVPEGTPVKAAESGTVAYAGNELKGYGNLVLIRHPNGYVSAYAHNGDLKVKRGDTVKRGQVVAQSGQTGNVQSPQLHFELRKGSSPVDPTPYLNN